MGRYEGTSNLQKVKGKTPKAQNSTGRYIYLEEKKSIKQKESLKVAIRCTLAETLIQNRQLLSKLQYVMENARMCLRRSKRLEPEHPVSISFAWLLCLIQQDYKDSKIQSATGSASPYEMFRKPWLWIVDGGMRKKIDRLYRKSMNSRMRIRMKTRMKMKMKMKMNIRMKRK